MTLYTDLQHIGLTANQATVYLALSRAGTARAGEIIKKTGFHRNLVYTALRELIEKKLITISRARDTAIYKALSSSRLLGDLQEKERVAKEIIEELTLLAKKATGGQEIVVYEGAEEFRRYEKNLYDSFKTDELIRYLGISPQWQELVGKNLEDRLIVIQTKKKARMRALTNAVTEGLRSYVERTKGLVDIRTNQLISSETNNTVILGDRILIRSFLEPVFLVEIVNKALARNYQGYFDLLWNKSK